MLLAFDAIRDHLPGRFWIDDYAADDAARDEVRTAIYYAFQRHGIEIPWPIQVQYEKDWPRDGSEREGRERGARCSPAWICSRRCRRSCGARSRASAPLAVYGSGEAIVRQGEAGQSMFVVCSGSVERRARADAPGNRAHRARRVFRRDVAADRRAAIGDRPRRRRRDRSSRSAPISSARLAAEHPQAIEQIGIAAMARRADLEQIKDRHGRSRDGRDEHADGADEEVPGTRRLFRLTTGARVPLSVPTSVAARDTRARSLRGIRCGTVLVDLPRSVPIVVVAVARAIPLLPGIVGILPSRASSRPFW